MALPIRKLIDQHMTQLQALGNLGQHNVGLVHTAIAEEMDSLVRYILQNADGQDDPVGWAIGLISPDKPTQPAGTGANQRAQRRGAAQTFKIDFVNLRRYRGINDLQSSLVGLAEHDIVVLSGANGAGKSSLLKALSGQPRLTQARFNSAPANQVQHEISYSPQRDDLIYDEQLAPFVMPDIQKILGAGLDANDANAAIRAAAGVTLLQNRKRVAERLCGIDRGRTFTLSSLRIEADAGAPTADIQIAYDTWKTRLTNYRTLCHASGSEPLRRDLAHWNTSAADLWCDSRSSGA